MPLSENALILTSFLTPFAFKIRKVSCFGSISPGLTRGTLNPSPALPSHFSQKRTKETEKEGSSGTVAVQLFQKLVPLLQPPLAPPKPRIGFNADYVLNIVQTTPAKLLDVVAVLADQPELRLAAGQVGTIVEVLAADVFEVEFCDPSGRTLGFAELRRDQILVLCHEVALAA